MTDSKEKKVTIAREPNRSLLERLAHHWGYTLEETAEVYAVLVDEARVPPSHVEHVVVAAELAWGEKHNAFPFPLWSAQTPFGFYNIEEVSGSDVPAYEVRLHAHHLVSVKDSLGEAKEAAQTDFNNRVLSCIDASPLPADNGRAE